MEYKKLGDYCEVKGGKRLPKGEQLVEYETNHPYLRISDYSNGSVNLNNLKYVTEETFQKISRYIINEGDIFLSIVGTIGIVDFIDYKLDSASLTENAVRIRSFNESVLSTKFLSYFLKSDQGQNEMFIRTVGSTQPKLAITRIKDINIPIIDIKSQQKISNILSTIDEKITLNKNLIANLEELSQTLFKRWFVDFEFPDENGNPYKSSGGEMIDSELGEIPEGWKIGHFSHFCKKPIAGDWGKEQKQGNYVKPVRVIRGADINDYSKGGKGKSPIRFILQKNFDNKKLISGDIIVEISGGSPTQSTGRTLLINNKVLKNSEYELVCTNFCKVIRPLDEKIGEWLAYYFNYLYFRDVFFNYENGTTGIKNLDYKSIMNTMKIIAPSTQILNNFHNLISKYKINIQYLGMENDYLTQLRDTLLPKLMSGEIEIPDDIEVNEDELSI